MKKRELETSVVYPFTDEADLLHKFINIYEEINPTIITGWNINGFDNPYLYNRLKRVLGETYANKLSPIGIVHWSERQEKYIFAGVSSMDYLELYKKFTFSELPNYRLDTVAKVELKRGKVEYEGNLDQLFSQDIEKFIEYNLVDVELVVDLDKKLQFIDLARAICHVGHVPYEDVMMSSRYLEGAILTYLRRKGLVSQNKQKYEGDNQDEKFTGAYVKEPIPGKYDWIYDLDLTSLYPSIIMTLNISPETKMAMVSNWDHEKYMKGEYEYVFINGDKIHIDKFKKFLEESQFTISANGVLYRTDKIGCIPGILDTWFNERVKYRALESQYGKEGNMELYSFYKRRQIVQKTLLNSLYGVLGLKSFRFYDSDNAEAVTISGQAVIKSTAQMVDIKYNKELGGSEINVVLTDNTNLTIYPNTILKIGDIEIKGSDINYTTPGVKSVKFTNKPQPISYNIYIDTDSVFFPALPLLANRNPYWSKMEDKDIIKDVDIIAGEVQDYLNKFYDILASKVFNVESGKHRLKIKKEFISRAGIWIAKKRYAQWIVAENGIAIDKLDVKGLDVVRSSYPAAFRKFMSELLLNILKGHTEEKITNDILNFKDSMPKLNTIEVSKNSSVKELSKYEIKNKSSLFQFKSGTPAHVKAAISHNVLLKYYQCPSKYEPMKNGDKIKWCYLKTNPFGLDSLGFKGYGDAPEIMDIVNKYIDYDRIFDAELLNKLIDFYNALNWDNPMSNKKQAEKFFSF
jgi:DNA polymerase elongation subunit (family B)